VEAVNNLPPIDPSGAQGDDFAWRVHDALDSWTGKVDTKASIVLAIEAAIAGFVITLSTGHGRLSALHGYHTNLEIGGLVLLAASVLASLAVVMPQLGRHRAKQNWSSNMIYFGHLRRWEPEKLAESLSRDMHAKEQLARQLVDMSKITWRKHAWLQWSLVLLVIASALLVCAGL
jgi:L-lactate permease